MNSSTRAATATPAELGASKFRLERQSDGQVLLKGDFRHRSLRYEIEGLIDSAKAHPGPITHRLSAGKRMIFEAIVISGRGRGRVELRFGAGVQGPRTLVLDVEALQRGALVTGYADGQELLPLRSTGCGCRINANDATSRPVLAWSADGVPTAVPLKLPAQMATDGLGLAGVIPAVVALQIGGGSGLGDVIDVIDWVFCYVECVGELLWCVFTQPNLPGTQDIFDTLCFVIWSGCTSICRINRPF